MIGGGRYEEAAAALRLSTEARAVIALVLHGNKGSGFSLQSTGPELLQFVPAFLRQVASQLEADLRGQGFGVAQELPVVECPLCKGEGKIRCEPG